MGELRHVCYDMGISIDDAHIEAFCKVLDGEDDRGVDFEEFEQFVRTLPMFNDGIDAQKEIVEAIEYYPEWMEWLIAEFKYYDTDRSGLIHKAGFAQLCKDFEGKFDHK